MAQVNDMKSPPGIVTFESLYRAIDRLMKRIDALEEKVNKTESTPKPQPVVKDKYIQEKKVKFK